MGGKAHSEAMAAAWANLRGLPHQTLAALFAADADRPAALTRRITWPVEPGSEAETGMLIDFSKTHLDEAALAAFEAAAFGRFLKAKRLRGAALARCCSTACFSSTTCACAARTS